MVGKFFNFLLAWTKPLRFPRATSPFALGSRTLQCVGASLACRQTAGGGLGDRTAELTAKGVGGRRAPPGQACSLGSAQGQASPDVNAGRNDGLPEVSLVGQPTGSRARPETLPFPGS